MNKSLLQGRAGSRMLVVVVVWLLAGRAACWADIFPTNRATTWQGQVGVEGGIPNSSNMTVYATVTPTQGLAAINNAIAGCPSNQVVQLTAGTYYLGGEIVFNQKSGVVLRGAGMGSTVLEFSSDGGIEIQGSGRDFQVISGGAPDGLVDWTGGYAKNSTVISVSSTAGLNVGQIVCLDQLNDGNDVDALLQQGCQYCGRGGNRSQCQRVRVTAINGTNVTLSAPIAMPTWRSSQSPQMWWIGGYVQRCGVENLAIHGRYSSGVGSYSANIELQDAVNCWVSGIRSEYPAIAHVAHYGGYRCEVRHSYFYFTQTGTSRSYGVLATLASCDWWEDNIFEGIPASTVSGWASSQNVISYNFATNHMFAGLPNWYMQSFWTHDAFSHMYLYEGNAAEGYRGDAIHGSGGYNVHFRNRYSGYQPGRTYPMYCIEGYVKNRNLSAVGNVLGTPGIHHVYQENLPIGGGVGIYQFGWDDVAGTNDPLVSATAYLHGNYDVVTAGIVWAATNSDHGIPASLLYSAKPAWFGDRPWPPFDPANGAALTANSMAHTNIPAGYRYVFGVDPPPAKQVKSLPVALASVAPASGPVGLGAVFSGAGSYSPQGVALSYYWTFGDGSVSTAANPVHPYQSPGVYRAQLTVSDGLHNARSAFLSVTVTNSGGH